MSKRSFDLIVACIGILLLAPVLLSIGVWIKLDSPGPAFFLQQRVGRWGKLFNIYKFRSMFFESNAPTELTVGGDPRVTRAGHFLRKYKLDELPQLLNVITGSMSLVGPRPEVPRYVACYPDEARSIVLSVTPGLTDWAAIEYVNENALLATYDDPERAYVEKILPVKLKYQIRYARERNFWLDLRILFRTFYVVIR